MKHSAISTKRSVEQLPIVSHHVTLPVELAASAEPRTHQYGIVSGCLAMKKEDHLHQETNIVPSHPNHDRTLLQAPQSNIRKTAINKYTSKNVLGGV